MGVIYKLTDEVVQFILQQKQEHSNLSCRELAEKVRQHFLKDVSKSAVHEVLKEANIVSPRGRKGAVKFQIPKEKKVQLLASLPLMDGQPKLIPVITEAPIVKLPEAIILPVVREKEEPLKPLQDLTGEWKLKEILMQTALWELFPKPWQGRDDCAHFDAIEEKELHEELLYRQILVGKFCFELEDGTSVCMDALFQKILEAAEETQTTPMPIERAIKEMADCIVNNLQPIVIKEFTKESLDVKFYDFLRAMEAEKGKNILKIGFFGPNNEQVVDFKRVIAFKRTFIIGVSMQTIDIKHLIESGPKEVNCVDVYFQKEPIKYVSKNMTLAGHVLRGIILLDHLENPCEALLSNMPQSVSDGELVRTFKCRHPIKAVSILESRSPIALKSAKDFFKEHVLQYFSDAMLKNDWEKWGNEPVKISSNQDIFYVNVMMPDSYGNFDNIGRGLSLINAQAIKNNQQQQVYFNLVKS